jgi:hypothetical protein
MGSKYSIFGLFNKTNKLTDHEIKSKIMSIDGGNDNNKEIKSLGKGMYNFRLKRYNVKNLIKFCVPHGYHLKEEKLNTGQPDELGFILNTTDNINTSNKNLKLQIILTILIIILGLIFFFVIPIWTKK